MGLILDGTTGISASGNIVGGNIVVTNNFAPASLSTAGNIQGAYILGNGSQLTGIDATSIQNGTSNVRTIASGNVTIGVAGTANVAVFATTGEYITGVISASGNITGGNLAGTLVTGTLTTAAQPNVTSVGTLSSLSVTGNITGGNITTAGTASLAGFTISANTITSQGQTLTIDPNTSGGIDGEVVIQGNLVVNGNMTYINSNNITTNDLTINMANNAATATAANGGGIEVGPAGAAYISLTYNSAANIWVASNGMSVQGVVQTAGNITGGNLLTGGQLSATGNITGGNITTTTINVATGGSSIKVGNPFATNGVIFVYGSSGFNDIILDGTDASITADGNITGANILTAGRVSATGNITGGNLSVSTGNITGGNIVNANANGVGNIGSSTTYFNTLFAKATSAQYADLAEKYTADAEYAPGTVVSFGGSAEVTKSTVSGDRRVAGVVSTDPAYIMNSGLTGTTATVALTGRVPTQVTGTVRKGDLMVSNGDGSARAEADPKAGSIIGKALADFDGETGTIEVVIGRL